MRGDSTGLTVAAVCALTMVLGACGEVGPGGAASPEEDAQAAQDDSLPGDAGPPSCSVSEGVDGDSLDGLGAMASAEGEETGTGQEEDAGPGSLDGQGPAVDAGPLTPDDVGEEIELGVQVGVLKPSVGFVPLEPGQSVEVIQGPQGGIHLDLAGRFVADDLEPPVHVAINGWTEDVGGDVVGVLEVSKLPVLGDAEVFTTPSLPVIFFQSMAEAYMGTPPSPTSASVCLYLALPDGREGLSCQEVVMVDNM